jgi:predicted MFS family arabinose efflux permease
VFGLLGLTPVSMRLFSNYTLELVDRANHAHYLGVMSMALAGPAILASLAVGVLIDMMGYEVAFWLVSGCQVVAFLLTFRLIEPRHKSLQAKPVPQ